MLKLKTTTNAKSKFIDQEKKVLFKSPTPTDRERQIRFGVETHISTKDIELKELLREWKPSVNIRHEKILTKICE